MSDIFTAPNNTEAQVEQTKTDQTANQATPAQAELAREIDVAKLPLRHTAPYPLRFFTTYREMPMGVSFDTQQEDETILLFLRSDFVTNVPWIVAAIFFIIAPLLLIFVFRITGDPFSFLSANFSLIVRVFYYLIVATYIYVNFITWYFNISLITNKRVIDVDFAQLVYKNVAGTKLSLVQDVSLSQVGVIRVIFDFGDVLIQTASAIDNFELHAVPRPVKVVEVVEALIGKEPSVP